MLTVIMKDGRKICYTGVDEIEWYPDEVKLVDKAGFWIARFNTDLVERVECEKPYRIIFPPQQKS